MQQQIVNAVPHDTASFFSLVNHPLKLKLYMLVNLPAAFFSGLKVQKAEGHTCTVSVPYKHFTKNPFRSTYFACLSMAAELSTGVLAMANIHKRKSTISMLITGMEAKFYKKSKGITYFTCNDGKQILTAIESSVTAGKSHEIRAYTVGRDEAEEVVAEFWFTWSFKAR